MNKMTQVMTLKLKDNNTTVEIAEMLHVSTTRARTLIVSAEHKIAMALIERKGLEKDFRRLALTPGKVLDPIVVAPPKFGGKKKTPASNSLAVSQISDPGNKTKTKSQKSKAKKNPGKGAITKKAIHATS